MGSEADYYSGLQTAIARAQPDSFEARGAIYDRAWQIALNRLYANQTASEHNIARERDAFLRAIQRIEFGGGTPAAPEGDTWATRARKWGAVPSQGAQPRKPRRRLFWRVATRMIGACVVLFFAAIAYGVIADPATQARLAQMMRGAIGNVSDRGSTTTAQATVGSAPTPAGTQRALLYEEGAAAGTTFSGQAVWRHRSKSAGTPSPVLSIDVRIPKKNFILEISMRRAPDGTAASHFVEFRFLQPNRSPSDAVEKVLGILMKGDERSRGINLEGQVVSVRPGVFLMGLSGTAADVGRNLRLLKERPWLDIPIVFKGGVRSILAIEKGATGEKALTQTFATWGQS